MAEAIFNGPNSARASFSTAAASVDDNLTVTAYGGNGNVIFLPCLNLSVSGGLEIAGEASGTVQFGSVGSSGYGSYGARTCFGDCGANGYHQDIVLTYGIPQTFHLHLDVSAGSQNYGSRTFVRNDALSQASFEGARLVDGNGFTVNGASFILSEAVPEPCTVALVALGGMVILVRRRLSPRRGAPPAH